MNRLLTALLVLPMFCLAGAYSGDKEAGDKVSGGKEAKGPAAKTPEVAFENLVKAAKEKDMKGFMANLTKESRKVTAGSLVFAMVGMKQFAKFQKELDTKPLEEVIARHNISEEKVLEAMKAAGKSKDPKDAIQTTKNLADMVKDPAAFVADAFKAMQDLDKGKAKKKNFLTALQDAKLKEVKVDGETARGEIDVQGKTEDIHFAREDNAWRIDLLPNILKQGKEKAPTKEKTPTKEAPPK